MALYQVTFKTPSAVVAPLMGPPPQPLGLDLELDLPLPRVVATKAAGAPPSVDLDPFAPAYGPKKMMPPRTRERHERDRKLVEEKLNEAAMVVEELERKKKLQRKMDTKATDKKMKSSSSPTTSGSEESENGRMGVGAAALSPDMFGLPLPGMKSKKKSKKNKKSKRNYNMKGSQEASLHSHNSDSNKSETDLLDVALLSPLSPSMPSYTAVAERSGGVPSTSSPEPPLGVGLDRKQNNHSVFFSSQQQQQQQQAFAFALERKRCGSQSVARSKKCKKEETLTLKKADVEMTNSNEEQQQQQQQPSLECLSDELLHKILCHLDPASASSMKATNKHFKEIIEEGLVWRKVMENLVGEGCAGYLGNKYQEVLGMEELVEQVVTLDKLKWSSRKVGGKVSPKRCNFASCAVGSKIFLFGGDHLQQALNDTFVLDLAQQRPEWKKMHMKSGVVQPPGRFGHTMRALDDKTLVLFGGCGNSGLFDDTYLLHLDDPSGPQWRQIKTKNNPEGRVWHASCVVQERKLVVFGGCDNVGELLDDMHVLDLEQIKEGLSKSKENSFYDDYSSLVAEWTQVETRWRPPARIGHSLTVTEDAQVLCFGGLANAGPVRARDNSSFVIDLASKEPKWTKLHHPHQDNSNNKSGRKGTGRPTSRGHSISRSGDGNNNNTNNATTTTTPSVNLPPARLEHVCWKLPGNRQMVFGGSPCMFGTPEVKFSETSKSDMFLLQTSPPPAQGNEGNISSSSHRGGLASWKKVSTQGEGPQSAWTHCACVLDHGTRCVVLGGSKGQDWLVNELYELKMINP
jgi:hypothetical protein